MLKPFRFGQLGYVLSAALIIAIGGTIYLTAREVEESAGWVDHTLEVLRAVAGFNEDVQRAQSAQRGFIIMGDRSFIAERDEAVQGARGWLARMTALTRDNQAQAARISALGPLLDARVETLHRGERIRAKSEPTNEDLAAIAAAGRAGTTRLMDLSNTVRAEEVRLLELRQAQQVRTFEWAKVVLLLSGGALLAMVLAAFLGFTREARKRAAIEARLRDLTENLPGTVFQLRRLRDGTYRYEFMSSGALDVRGVSREDALRDARAVFDTIHPGDRERVMAAMESAGAQTGPLEVDYRVLMPDGTERWVHKSARPRREPDGSVFWNGHWTDVTRMRQLDGEIRRAKEAAEDATRAKSTFLATMSHEIRTPMNGVLGMLELLALSRLDADQRATLNVVRESGAALLRIIDDILDFSKIEAGRLDLKPEPARLGRVVERVRNVYAGNASSKGLLLKSYVDPLLSSGYVVDPVRLQQVLGNLVSNAIKFTDRGEIEVRAELIQRRAGHDKLCFSVRDTGVGISSEDQARLFTAFTQLDGSARTLGGTGLGLSISRRLSELMGGKLTMESAPGAGTYMRLTLSLPPCAAPPDKAVDGPLLPAAAVGRREPPAAAAAVAEGTYVLIVDDHPINRMVLHRQVRALGYAAATAENGVDALERWRSGNFAAIITDCNMPDMDGYELARRIRVSEAGDGSRRTTIIACTANALGGDAEKCFAAGMDDYIAKPVELRQLATKLEQWLPLPRTPSPVQPAAQNAPASSGSIPVLDSVALSEASGGDAELQHEILSRYREYLGGDMRLLGQAIEVSDAGEARRLAHRVKGAARTVGAHALAQAAERIERLAADAPKAEWHSGLLDLQAERGRIEDRLEALLGSTEQPGSAS